MRKRFKKGQRIILMCNSARSGIYCGRFEGACVVHLDRPIITRQRDVVHTMLAHESNLFPQREKKGRTR